ncbi:hypothetical protein HD806DRAFT_524440 [Xylariaceae sp. AK1471]|nr:hypothetical protein HD806DRAFT_524440 [Xylariaceae sp. AK1471]
MADAPPSIQQTHRAFPDVKLNAALLDFAPRYMKEKLEHLAQECNQRVERNLLPRFEALLREIDQERDAFEQHKQEAARDLRDQLNLLRFDAAAVDDAIVQLHAVSPTCLNLLPRASSLMIPVSEAASLCAPSTAASSDGAFDTPDADKSSQAAVSPTLAPETSSQSAQNQTAQAELRASPTKPPSFDSQVHVQVIAEYSSASCSPKRSGTEGQNESDTPYKRQRIADETKKPPETVRPKIERRVAFPNLMTGECIFRHAERRGFFVIRCDHCESGFFTEPPLLYNRALKHLQKHGVTHLDEEELTNEYIFERFAWQGMSDIPVDGDEMASKYWIREHLGAMPHTFIPVKSARDASRADDMEDIVRKHQEIDDDFSPPFPQLRESLRNRQSDHEEDHEKPRRALRNVPRPDYAEMVANKDFWNAPEMDNEVGSVGRTRATELMQVVDDIPHDH